MMDWSRQTLKSDERGYGDSLARPQGKLPLALAVIATALGLVIGFAYLTSFRRLERDMTRLSQQTEALSQQTEALSQQTEALSRQVERAEKQSQMSAQQASQSAANAEAAAQQRDLAKQAQSNSEAQAEVARQQAAAQQQRADQATQKAEEYRKAREAELAKLQQALGQIAETHRTAMGLVMTLDSKSIRFDFDKADIKPEYRDILNRVAGILMTLKGFTIAIYGYTDDVGTQTYNLQLSRRRAEAVRDFLVQTGISATILSTKGFGKSDPRTPGNSEQARAANRRVEIAIVESKIVTDIVPVEPK